MYKGYCPGGANGFEYFRLWNTKEQRMSTIMTLPEMFHEYSVSVWGERPFLKAIEEDTAIVMPSVGLDDVEGVALMKHDIVVWTVNKGLSRGVVEYGHYEWEGHMYFGWYVDCGDHIIPLSANSWKRLGNKYEHPEMLPEAFLVDANQT